MKIDGGDKKICAVQENISNIEINATGLKESCNWTIFISTQTDKEVTVVSQK